MSFFLGTQSVSKRVFRLGVVLCATFLLFQFVSLYLSWPKQLTLGVVSVVLVIVINRSTRSHVVTLALMLFSLAATLRYGWWRVHMILQFFSDESNNRFNIDSVLMLVLLSAEAYTILIMVLGFMQTSSPLHRKPIPLPEDEDLWPHVDVLIPTYNEPLSLVRYTALAAINIDYPPEKLHVYILDDGSRASFREFAEEAGVGYVVREKHNHAKAGNINHALSTMDSPLVTIFDCDHVPTRSFLQVTVGWFLAEKKLAMLQTPHFFYSPDPFERNLLQYKTIPNEGELFYGVIQDGNDLWNATFFCGSCAVIRRAALDEVGGIATETVTEDAHTSLRMQKRGWNTAYINLPQAAGLATETLSAHVGQRVRWARGMIQILRTDNPLLATGMKFSQRLCYFNAMLHFMYAVPRLIFLCAPLIYMLAGRTIIPGYWVAILAYAMPHLFISSITNSRVQGKHRHSFWNEIYETVLAPYILMPTLLALINPKLGEFNVTDKGSTLSETTFDRHIVAPTGWLLLLNFIGICAVPYRLLVTDPTHPGTVISNLIWILFNMVILGVAAAVANEQQQRRSSVRIPAKIPIQIHLADGTVAGGMSEDMSVGGASLVLTDITTAQKGDHLHLSFPLQTGDDQVGAEVVGLRDNHIRLQFTALNITEQETLTRALYSRANSWLRTRVIEEDRPLLSLMRVVRLSFIGFHQILRGLLPRKKKLVAASVVILASLFAATAISAQIPGAQAIGAPILPTQAATPGQTPLMTPAANKPVPTTPQPQQLIKLLVPETARVTAAEANEQITLKDMGVHGSVEMHGPKSSYALGFVLGHDLLPRRASLDLTYHFSEDLVAGSGVIKVILNGTPIAEIDASASAQKAGHYDFASLPIPADLLVRDNSLSFEFSGGTLLQLETQTHTTVLANVGATSVLRVTGDHLAAKADLGRLPLPFFDPDMQTTTVLHFAFLTQPTPHTLRAAAVVASWFGIIASSKPVRFTVTVGAIPQGDVIVFANPTASLPPALQVPDGGPALSVRSNPTDPTHTALVLSGDDDDQLLRVARSVSLMTVNHPRADGSTPQFGDSVHIGEFDLPAARKPDDAPRWLPTDHLVSLWDLGSSTGLQSDGTKTLPVYLRVAPDMYYGENQNLNLKISYRYNARPLAPGSALRVFINGKLINEAPLPPGSQLTNLDRNVILPVAEMRPFGNTMLFNFDFIPSSPGSENSGTANKLFGAILRNSYLDVRGLAHWTKMPNLELFANAGFPFTIRADLADTVVIVPAAPTAKEIALLLALMSHCGTQTGYPALRVDIAGPDAVMSAGHDYLMLGNVTDQPGFSLLEPSLPVTFDTDGLHVKQATGWRSVFARYWHRISGKLSSSDDRPSNTDGSPDVLLEGIESPFFPNRSIVMLALRNDDAVDPFTDVFLERSQSSDIANSVSMLRNGQFHSYDLDTRDYHVGNIATYPLMRIWFAEHFWLLLLAVALLSVVLGTYARDFLGLLRDSRLSIKP